MKQPKFHHVYTEDTGLIEMYAENKLLAEWSCANSEYIEDEIKQFQSIYEAGMQFYTENSRDTIDPKQFIGEMKERNEYRKILDECLFAFNNLKGQKIENGGGMTTYSLASKIEASFFKFDAI